MEKYVNSDIKTFKSFYTDEVFERSLLDAILICNINKLETRALFYENMSYIPNCCKIKFEEIDIFKRLSCPEYFDKIASMAFPNGEFEDILRIRLLKKDIKTYNTIKIDKNFKNNFFNLINLCKNENIVDQHSFNMAKARCPMWFGIDFEQLSYFERVKDFNYLKKIQELSQILDMEEDYKQKKGQIIPFSEIQANAKK